MQRHRPSTNPAVDYYVFPFLHDFYMQQLECFFMPNIFASGAAAGNSWAIADRLAKLHAVCFLYLFCGQ